jgi:hypothetical protein
MAACREGNAGIVKLLLNSEKVTSQLIGATAMVGDLLAFCFRFYYYFLDLIVMVQIGLLTAFSLACESGNEAVVLLFLESDKVKTMHIENSLFVSIPDDRLQLAWFAEVSLIFRVYWQC